MQPGGGLEEQLLDLDEICMSIISKLVTWPPLQVIPMVNAKSVKVLELSLQEHLTPSHMQAAPVPVGQLNRVMPPKEIALAIKLFTAKSPLLT